LRPETSKLMPGSYTYMLAMRPGVRNMRVRRDVTFDLLAAAPVYGTSILLDITLRPSHGRTSMQDLSPSAHFPGGSITNIIHSKSTMSA
jgi:hypothetical protein